MSFTQIAAACHRRQCAPQSLLDALNTTPVTQTGATDQRRPCAPHPFWRVWIPRLPHRQKPGAATTRAGVPSGGSGYCGCHGPAATMRAGAPYGSGERDCHGDIISCVLIFCGAMSRSAVGDRMPVVCYDIMTRGNDDKIGWVRLSGGGGIDKRMSDWRWYDIIW